MTSPIDILRMLADAPSKVVWFNRRLSEQDWVSFLTDCENKRQVRWDANHEATLYEIIACIVAVTTQLPIDNIMEIKKVTFVNQKGYNLVSVGGAYVVLHYLIANDVPQEVVSNATVGGGVRVSALGTYGEFYKGQ